MLETSVTSLYRLLMLGSSRMEPWKRGCLKKTDVAGRGMDRLSHGHLDSLFARHLYLCGRTLGINRGARGLGRGRGRGGGLVLVGLEERHG